MNQCGKLELQNSILEEFSLGIRKKLSVVEILQRVKSSVFALEGIPPKSNTAQTDELTQLIVQISTGYKIDRVPKFEEVYQILYNNDITQTDVEQEDKIKQVEGNYEEYFSKQGFLDLYKNAESVGIKAQSDFLHRIVELAIYNPNSSDLVITSGLLNSNLYEYQNELWKTVVDYLNKYHKNHGLNLDSIQDFPKLQTEIFKLLTNNGILDGNTILHRSQNILASNKNFIKAFNAFNLLIHFDTLLSKTFGKNIDINSNLKNTYGINKDIAKYRFVAGSNLQSHWRTTDDPDVNKETANIVKILISSIPLYSSSNSLIPNAYLEFNQYTHIINQIRNLPKETRNLQIPNSIYKLYQNHLQNNNIQTLGDLIDHIRIGKPTLEYKILYETILHLYNNGYNLYEKQYKHYIKGLNNVDISYIQSIYNYVFNTEKSLYSKFIDYTGENNFYEFIIQSMLTLSPTNFTQYKSRSSDDSTLVVKNMHLEASDKNAKFIENYLLTAYNPIMPNQIYWKNIKDRLSIQYDGEYIKFKIGNNFEVKYNPKLGNEPIVTGEFNENVFKELDIITNFGNIYEIFSNIYDNKSGITETIIRFYAPLISNIYFNNEYESILTDTEKFNIDGDNITPKSKKIKLDTAVNKFYSKDTKPAYLDKYNQYSIIPKKYYSNYTQLVRAYSILKGVTTKSTVSDSEGNQLGISNMSRVYEGIRTQIQQIKNSENSPLKNLAIVQSDLVEDYIVSRELYKGKKLIDMTPNESYFLSLVVDFLPRGTVNNDLSDRDDMYFYPYVIADKSVIMKTRVSRTNLDEILRNLYKKSKTYKTWYQSLSQEDKDRNNFDFNFLNKVSKVDLIHNAIQLELGDVYEGVLTQVKTKWDKLIEFIQQKTGTSNTFNAIYDFSGFEEFLADVNKRSNNEHTPKQFLNYWISEYQKIDSNLVFRENIEYIFINGNLKTNRSIIAKVHRFKPESKLLPKDLNIYTNYQFYTDYKEFVSDKEEKLLFDLLDNNFAIDTHLDNKYFGINKFKNYKEWIGKDDKVILAKAVKGNEFIDIRKIKDFHKFKNELEPQGYKLVIHPIIEEYNWTDYLISQETMYTHMGIPEINPDKAALKAYDVTLFHERNEESNRNTAQTKRNVTESAIMNLYTPGLEKGLPDVLNCACVEDMETPVFNYTGDTGEANIWDGSIWVDGAYWYLQNHSLGSSAAGPTQKSIWHYMDPETAAVTIVKSACPTIDNYACRNSVHWRNIIKKMRSSIKWDKPYNLSKELSELDIYYKNEKGIYKKRDSFEFNINSLNEAEYTYVEYTVNENGDLLDDGTIQTKIITNNWDLFELLGGINAVSLNLNGVLSQDPKHNDISNKQLADLMCIRINREQPLKNLNIAYLISRSAIKKGIGNTNLQSTYNDESPLTYLKLKLGYFGIQLDKTHEAEGSHLNILSQVTNALASRGYTGLQASEMYQALKSVAEDAMTPFTNEYAEILGITHKGKIADLIAKKLAYQDSQGGGDILHSIVADLIKLSNEGIDLSTSNINLPISLPATYKKLISVVSSTLSHLAIRLKFDGILAVLTPSHDIYKIFNGKQLKDFNSYEELIAEEKKADFIPVYKLSPGTTYKRFINGQFAGFADITDPNKYWQEQAFFADQFGKGVKFTYKEALYSEETYTNSEGKTERIITPIGRNLEPYNVFFSDGITTFSMWDLVSVRKMWLASDIETRKKLRKEFQEDLLRIQNKESVEVNTYGFSGVTSVLVKPISVEVKPYENIMSNRLCKEFGVSPSTNINKITEGFFLEQLRAKFKTKVNDNNFDVEIKQYNGDHIYLIQQGSSTTFTNLRQDYNASTFIDSAGRIWLTDINGEKTHQLSSLNDKVYLDDEGNRIIYTNNLKFYSDLYSDNNQLISPKYTDESSVLDIDPVWNQMNESFKTKYEGQYDINFELLRSDFELLKEVAEGSYLYKKLERQAKQKYNSFQMSLNTLVARIPSQSMQSVMAMRTVGFDETGLNNVSVSIWQIWLQGSDFDIDCASMLSYAFDRNGNFIHWSPLAIINSDEILFKESLKLPLPNKNKIITVGYNSDRDDRLIEVLQQYSQLNRSNLLNKAKLLREINTFDRLVLNTDEYNAYIKVIEEINSHNNYLNKLKLEHNDISENIKNFISFNMFDIIANPVNVIQAQSSIDDAVKIFKNRATNTEKAKVTDRNQPGNSYSKMLELSTNMTGKAVISISAASMKAMLGITNATNHALNTLDPNEIINVVFDTDILGVFYTIAGNSYSEVLTAKRFNFAERTRQAMSIENTDERNAELIQIEEDKSSFNKMAASVLTNVKNEEDILLMLSALLSLATDNAKELVLDKINAGSELVSLYVAGITFGMPFTDLTDIIISPTIDTISKIMKEDSFNGYDGMARFDQVIKYINNGPSSIFGSIFNKEKYINNFIEALEEAAKKGGQISIIQEIKNSIENNKNTSSNQDDEDFDDYILYEEPIDEESIDEKSTKYNSYHLRKMLTSLNWTPEMSKIFLDTLNKSDSNYKWIRLIDDLEKWFDIKELINNDIISYSTNPEIDNSLISENKIYEFNGNWTRHEVSMDTNSLYIFTDNTDRDSGKTLINPDSEYAKKYGKNKHYPTTTQAVIRGLDNAMPISTQRWYHDGAKGNSGRWTDDAFEKFKQTIDTEIEAIKQKWDTGNYSRLVVGSIAGFFNTKISNITKERVPKIYDYLLIKLNELFEYVNNSQINNNISQQLSSIKRFDEAVKLYRASTEMTSLVSYFGLNQGIPTDPNELIAIRTKFESMFEDAINFKNPNNKQTIYKGEKITVVEAIKKIKENRKIFPVEKIYKISMNNFFADESYRNEVVEAYNAIKEFQNIPYILIHNEHYYSYMELISTLINVYSKVSKKFKTINDFADSIIKKVNVYKSDEKLRVLKSIENSIDTIINNTWMSTTFEPFIIPEGIISVDASDKPYTTTAPTPIILGTDWGNKAFKIYIEQKVMPDLQAGKLGPNIVRSLGNRLLNALTPMIDSDVTNNMDIVYTLPIEMIPKTPEEEVIFNSYKDSLSNLRNVQYDNGFEKHSVINLLYLYNMITYNNKISKYALTGLFGSLIQAHNLDIHEKYIKFIADYDNNNIELKGFNLTSIAQRAAPIGNRYNAKTNMIKELNSSTGKYVLYEKGENGYQYRNYIPLSTGNIFKNSIVLSPDITITISSNGELESIFTNKGNLDIEEYNKTVTSEYQIKSKKDLLVKYKQIVNGKEIDTLDIKLTLENINRVLNNPC